MKGEGSVSGTRRQVWPRKLAWELAMLRSLIAGAVLGYEQCLQEVETGLVLPPVPDGKLRKVFLSWS